MTDSFFCQTHNDCTVDLSNFVINCALIAVCLCTILWKISKKLSLLSTKEEAKFAEHNCRWFLFVILFIICIAEIGDAFIVPSSTPFVSHSLKIPSVFSLLAALTTAYFYTKMEKWNKLKPMFILLIYWPVVTASKVFKLATLYHSGLDGHHLAVTITLCYLVVYLLSFLIEINLVWTNKYLSSWQSIALPINDPPDTRYRRPWVNLPSKATFYWMNALILRALKQPITQQCLGSLAQECQVQGHFNKFKEIYLTQSDKSKNKASLFKSFLVFLWRPMLLSGLLKLIIELISLIAPIAVGVIITYLVDYVYHRPTTPIQGHPVTVSDFLRNGYVMASVLLLSGVSRSIFTHNLIHLTSRVAIRARCLVQMLVYEKSLKLSVWPKETQTADADEIHCLVTNDADNLMQFLIVFNDIWAFFFKLIILTVLIYLQLGYGAFIGVCVSILFLIPAQFQLRRIMEKSENDIQTIKRGRLRKMEELLLKMLSLKMNSWEIFFAHKIRHIRQSESRLLLLISLCWWLHDVLTWAALVLMSVIAFSVYTSAEREILTPQAAFTAVALFNHILFALFLSPVLISVSINALASVRKVERFLATDELSDKRFNDSELEDSTVLEFEDDSGSVVLRIKDDFNDRSDRIRDTAIFLSDSDEEVTGDVDSAIQLASASFSWDQNNVEPVLKDLTVNIPIGKITLVCSRNKSCERAFLLTLLGELHTVNGSIIWTRNSPIAFVPLIPWFQRETSIRDNILFHVPYDAQRYNRIITACGLQGEFDQWPSGDLSLINDIDLSMSQKHRISIARALYSKCKIIILDDVFPSMDPVLSLFVFEEGLKKLALRYRRTVIAISRQTHILPMGDLIIVLDNQTLKFQGNWRQLQEWDPDLESTLTPNSSLPNDDKLTDTANHPLEINENLKPALRISNRGVLQMMGIYFDRQLIPKAITNPDLSIVDEHNTSDLKDESGELDDSRAPVIKQDDKKDGKDLVSTLNLLGNFCMDHLKWWFLLALCILFVLTQLFLVSKDIWLAKWSNQWHAQNESEYSGHFLTVYNVLCLLAMISLGVLTVVCAMAATRSLSSFYNSIIDSSLSFNNFSTAKVNNLVSALRIHFAQFDEKIPISYHIFWVGLLCVMITFITFGVSLFMFILFIFFAAFIYVFQRLYNKFYRNVNELLTTSTERVTNHLMESLNGLVLIRSFREEKNFKEKLIDALDTNQLTFLIMDSTRRWMELILDFSLSLLIFVISLIAIHNGANGSLTPGTVGLALVYILMLPTFLKWLIYSWSEVRSDINSLQTLEPYSRISSDDNQGTMIPDWPSNGKIQIENLFFPPVLTGVSFLINPGEKLGIYDRNGSDLFFLAQMFLRLMPVPEGSILIDDADISKLLPVLLRLRIAVIAKDDYIFNETIRSNLDMKGSFADEELWSVLKTVNLKYKISKINGGLDFELKSDTKVLTTNDIQLLCLARTILRKPRIIVTNQLDISLLKTVFDVFPTYSTIALSTDFTSLGICDRIIEIENGQIVD